MNKECWNCGESLKDAIPIRSQFIKVCRHCLKENKWMLDQGQSPVGYAFDEDLLDKAIGEVSNESKIVVSSVDLDIAYKYNSLIDLTLELEELIGKGE